MLQNEMNEDTLHRELDDIPNLSVLLQYLHNGRLLDRNRAMVVLASYRKVPSQTICAFLGVGKAFVRKYRNKFKTSADAAILQSGTRIQGNSQGKSLLTSGTFGSLECPGNFTCRRLRPSKGF